MNHHAALRVDTLSALETLHVLRGCRLGDLARLARDTDIVDLAPGRVIDRAGTVARQFVGVVDGYVQGTAADGREIVLGPGDHLGAHEIVDGVPLAMTYTSLTVATVAVTFGPAFRAVATEVPRLADAVRRPSAHRPPPRAVALAH